MRIYGAGALEEIRQSIDLGVVGILTNPQGFEQYFKGELTLKEITQAIIELSDLPVFIQIHGETTEKIVAYARELHQVSPQVGFKIIANEKGFHAISILQKEGISCIATCLFTLAQASVAATVGATGICPFVSRAQAIGMDAFATLSEIKRGYERLTNAPEIIAVSMKSVADVELALRAGVDAVGMRYPMIRDMMSHPLSDKAELLFGKNWGNVKGEDAAYLASGMKMEGIAE